MRSKSHVVAAALALLVLTGVASAVGATPAPSVAIVSPAAGDATNAQPLAVEVRFAASASDGTSAGPTGNVHTLVLELDGREVGRHATPPQVKSGSHQFTVGL